MISKPAHYVSPPSAVSGTEVVSLSDLHPVVFAGQTRPPLLHDSRMQISLASCNSVAAEYIAHCHADPRSRTVGLGSIAPIRHYAHK